MQIDAAIIGIAVTVLLALLGLSYGYGSLNTRVNGHKDNINTLFSKLGEYQKENKADHEKILNKINGLKNGG